MERFPPIAGLGIDESGQTRRFDYGLTPTEPLHADVTRSEGDTLLTVHAHAGIEFSILLSGAQEAHYEDFVRPLRPGDVSLCATWEPHGWRSTAPDTEGVVLMFLPDFLGEETLGDASWLQLFAVPPAERPQVTSDELRESMLALGREMQREILERRPGWESAVRLDLLRALLALKREWKVPALPKSRIRVSAGNLPRIMPALVLVHTRPARRVTVEEAAKACGLSRAQFCLTFHNIIGISFGQFCTRFRLALVAAMLLSTDMPMNAIAQRTGFVDASHLHRVFVKRYACTPGQYRMQNQVQTSSA